jgi:acyl dehydratase
MNEYYLEDLSAGTVFVTGRRRVTEEQIKAFAAEYDPQPFHLDNEAARRSIFDGLSASGWHTVAMTMRLAVDSDFKLAGGFIGLGVDEIRWARPVRPGDELHVEAEVLEARPSKSRPEYGVAKMKLTTLNQVGEAVQEMVTKVLVPRRTPGDQVEAAG